MGIWTGIKKALNSTLGTSEFQPLDKMIKSQRTYTASDSVLVPLISGASMAMPSTIKKIPGVTFTSKVNGSIRISGQLTYYRSSSTQDMVAVIRIYDDNVGSHKDINVALTGQTDQRVSEAFEMDIPITKDTTYSFGYYVVNAGAAWLNTLKLCGQITDLSMLDYTLA